VTAAGSATAGALRPVFRGRRLCVVGNVNRDLRTAPFAPAPGLFEDGETSVDFIREALGGGGANSAVFAAMLGARARLVAKVGGDELGGQLRRELKQREVRPFLATDTSRPTGTSINLVYATGRRHFVSCLPASATLRFGDVDPAALRGVDHVLRADVWFSEPMLFGGNERLLRAAKAAGADTSLDMNWDPHWGRAPARQVARRKRAVRDVLPLVDLVHGNVRELCAFTDTSRLSAALDWIAGWGAAAIVVHMGTKGSGYYADGRFTTSPCVRARKVVNATGTGDLLSVMMMLLHRDPRPAGEKLAMANGVVSAYVAGERAFARIVPAARSGQRRGDAGLIRVAEATRPRPLRKRSG
jgi:sugar/nucleoside kinase (ribokinase family)